MKSGLRKSGRCIKLWFDVEGGMLGFSVMNVSVLKKPARRGVAKVIAAIVKILHDDQGLAIRLSEQAEELEADAKVVGNQGGV